MKKNGVAIHDNSEKAFICAPLGHIFTKSRRMILGVLLLIHRYKSAIATSPLLEIELVEEDRDIDNDLGNFTDRKGDSPESPEASCK